MRDSLKQIGVLSLPLPALVLAGFLAGFSYQQEASADPPKQPDATVQLSQIQAAFIGSGSGGSGRLYYKGRTYPFTVGGLGVGGIGASTIEATGNVYNLTRLSQFPGTYVQGRYGAVFGDLSTGRLWLKNGDGVVMSLNAKRTGLMLSLGGDAVVITMQNR